jgi:hypothetical protein
MVSAMSEAAAASAAAASSSEASPPLKQLQQRDAAPFSPPPPPSSRKLRTIPSRQNELGSSGDSSFSPEPGTTDGSRSAGETRSTWRSNSRFSRDLGAAGDGSICAAALMADQTERERRGVSLEALVLVCTDRMSQAEPSPPAVDESVI